MFTTKEEALTAMQEVAAMMEFVLDVADEGNEELGAMLGKIEAQHNEIFDAVLQLKKSSDRYLNIEMRNYTALTVLQAQRTIQKVKAII